MNLVRKDLVISLLWVVICGTFYFGITSTSRADDVYTIIVKKQETKQKGRWSLTEWLETRDRMRLMDLWLALHSPSPYEFYIGGNYQINQASPGGQSNAWEGHLAAFASIFGLEGRYESNPISGQINRWHGIFNLRIFGFHDQGTNITLQGGLRSTDHGGISYRNALAGVSINIYLARYFGIEGLYRYYFSSTPNSSGVSFSGERYQAGVFIDFKMVRIYGDYLYSPETLMTTNGGIIGTKVYF